MCSVPAILLITADDKDQPLQCKREGELRWNKTQIKLQPVALPQFSALNIFLPGTNSQVKDYGEGKKENHEKRHAVLLLSALLHLGV